MVITFYSIFLHATWISCFILFVFICGFVYYWRINLVTDFYHKEGQNWHFWKTPHRCVPQWTMVADHYPDLKPETATVFFLVATQILTSEKMCQTEGLFEVKKKSCKNKKKFPENNAQKKREK